MLRPDISAAEKTQQLFEVLRIATRENDAKPFVANLKTLASLSFRQVTDLVDIILERGDREHLLLFLFEAGINFNEVPNVLDQLAKNANRWNDAATKTALTLMVLGVKWSSENVHPGICNADNELLNTTSSSAHVYPLLRYETKDTAVAALRKKMHAFFLTQNRLSDTWNFVHGLFIYASENGLSRCVINLLDFRWPALIYVSNNPAFNCNDWKYIYSLSDPRLLETSPKKPKSALVTKAPVVVAPPAATQTEFVSYTLNTTPLNIPFVADNAPPAAEKAEPSKKFTPAKPKFFVTNGAKVSARPFLPYIDVNYKNNSGETAYTLATYHNHDEVLKALARRSELVRDNPPVAPVADEKAEKIKILIAKVLSAVKLKKMPFFLTVMKEVVAAKIDEQVLINLCIENITGQKLKHAKIPFFAKRLEQELEVLNNFFSDYRRMQQAAIPANKPK